MNRRTLKALGSQSSGGVLMSSSGHQGWCWEVEVLELGLLNEEVWDRKREIPGKENWRSKGIQPGLRLQHLCPLSHPQDNVRRSETSMICRNLWVFIDFRRVIDVPSRQFRSAHECKLTNRYQPELSQHPLALPSLAILAPPPSRGSPLPLIWHLNPGRQRVGFGCLSLGRMVH